MTVERWDRSMAINVRGYMLGCKHAIPAMLKSGGGSIIQTSSAVSLFGSLAIGAYATAKGAINTLTMDVAVQYGKQGIRCNAVLPGVVLAEPGSAPLPPRVSASAFASAIAMYEAHTLTPHTARPIDIANIVLFLASDEARVVTGQLLRVDGGYFNHAPTYADQVRQMASQDAPS
jgi:NAD(P)-dependent dehydrogenase (short-subunit alcohol dehydrogenase family)